MRKEYRVNIIPTASGDKYDIDVLHDGRFVGEMGKRFNHLYTGKGTSRKIAVLAKVRAKEYVEELERNGYQQVDFGGGKCYF